MIKIDYSNIKTIRKSNGLTLDQLADKTNSSKSYIHQLENNNVNPSHIKLILISMVFGCAFNDLFSVEYTEDE